MGDFGPKCFDIWLTGKKKPQVWSLLEREHDYH